MIDNFHLKNFRGIPASAHDPYFSKEGYLPNHPSEYDHNPPYSKYWLNTPKNGPLVYCYPPHTHHELELQYIVTGKLHTVINGKDITLHSGDMVIINPFDNHDGYTILSDEPLYYIFSIIDLSFFAQSLPFSAAKTIKDIHRGAARFRECVSQRELESKSAFAGSAAPPNLESIFRRLHDDYDNRDECRMTAAIYELLAILIKYCVSDETENKLNPDFEFICRVSDIIDRRYASDLTTAIMSDELSYSKSYFCRRFRECFGVPFSDYLCNHRLQCALNMRVDNDTTLTDIATRVGFNDYAYFSRSFRKFTGMNPKQYFLE